MRERSGDMKKAILTAILATFAGSAMASAAAITYGNIVVSQVGDGSGALNSNATAVILKEFTVGGSLVQSIPLPTATTATAITLSGSATSEGALHLSTDKQYLSIAGYGATPGTASITGATASTVNRVVGIIPVGTGVVDGSTRLTDAYNGSNIRSAFTTNGTDIWTGGNGGSGQGPSAGVRYMTIGATTSTQVSGSSSNQRVVTIQNGQLYSSSPTGALLGVTQIGTGTPTTSGQTVTLLPGMPTTGTHSNYDYWFKDASTLYMADDGSAANGGGIQKWVLSSGTWSLVYTLLNNGSSTTATRGLAGYIDGNGDAVLFGTGGSTLFTVTDTGASAAATVLATAPANTAFRGVELVPEPTSFGLLSLGIMAMSRRRRPN